MKGMTLLELLVVIAIIGVLAGIGTPSIIALSKGSKTRTAAKMVTDEITACRGKAIALRTNVVLEFAPDNRSLRQHYWQYENQWDELEKEWVTVKVEKFTEWKSLPDIFLFSLIDGETIKFLPSGNINSSLAVSGKITFQLLNTTNGKLIDIEIVTITGRAKAIF